jgi:hypothetical protein
MGVGFDIKAQSWFDGLGITIPKTTVPKNLDLFCTDLGFRLKIIPREVIRLMRERK